MLKQCVKMCFIVKTQQPARQIVKFNRKNTNIVNQLRCISVYSNLYSLTRLTQVSDEKLIEILTKSFGISKQQREMIFYENNFVQKFSHEHIIKVFQVCHDFKVDKSLILKNLDILEIKPETLQEKLKLIEKLSLSDINLGFPLVKMPLKTLSRLVRYNKNNLKERLFYIADKFKKSPYEVAESISNRHFVYTMQFQQFESAVNVLLDYGVLPENIMKDWWVLNYKPIVIKQRLEKSIKAGRKKLMPWMVKCAEPVFRRTIFLTKNFQKELLGGEKSLKTYLEEILNCSSQNVDEMCKTFPNLHKVRVHKIKKVHGILIKRGYTNDEIRAAPKVFAHSIETIETRLNKLEEKGIKKASLKSVCKSAKDFEHYLDSQQKQIKVNKLSP